MATPRQETVGDKIKATVGDVYARHRLTTWVCGVTFLATVYGGKHSQFTYLACFILAALVIPLVYLARRGVARALWTWKFRRLLAADSLPFPGRKEAGKFRKRERARMAKLRKQFPAFCGTYGLTNAAKLAPTMRKMRSLSNGDITADISPGPMAIKGGVKKFVELESEMGVICGAEHGCRVKPFGVGNARITFLWTERMGQKIPIQDLMVSDDEHISYGEDEDGKVSAIWMALSVLIVGLTGTGKSSLLWALITDLLRKVTFWIYVIDPKGGQELGMFKRLVGATRGKMTVKDWVGNATDAKRVIDAVHTELKRRQDLLLGIRKWSVKMSAEFPLIVVPIDEALELMTVIDKDSLGKLMTVISQGRAAGVMVIMLCQLPQKEILGQTRSIIAQRLSLGTESPIDTGLIFGDAQAEAKGAKCSEIRAPGVGCSRIEGRIGYSMFRGAYVDDDDIEQIIAGNLPAGMGVGKAEQDDLHAVYRYFTSDGQWLYIGITNDFDRRDKEHRAKFVAGDPKHYWYGYVDHSATIITQAGRGEAGRKAAKAEETKLIKIWKPPGNTAENEGNPMQGRAITVTPKSGWLHRTPKGDPAQVFVPPPWETEGQAPVVREQGQKSITAGPAKPARRPATQQNRKRWSRRPRPVPAAADPVTVEPDAVLEPVANWYGSE